MAESLTIRPAFVARFGARQQATKKFGYALMIVGPNFPEGPLSGLVDAAYPKLTIEYFFHGDVRLRPIPNFMQNTYEGSRAGIPGKPVMVPREIGSRWTSKYIMHVNFFDVNGGQIFWWSWKPEENDEVAARGIR